MPRRTIKISDRREFVVRKAIPVEVGDDAVAAPVGQAGQPAAEVLFHEQVPADPGGCQVRSDAGDDLPVVYLVRIEQQRDAMDTMWIAHLGHHAVDWVRGVRVARTETNDRGPDPAGSTRG